jgi:hypothetical protein
MKGKKRKEEKNGGNLSIVISNSAQDFREGAIKD